MKIEVVLADITTMSVDVIVNAANPALIRGGGVCGAIHNAAGPKLEEDCMMGYPMGIHTGEAVITNAYDLPARWVIHTTGPKFNPDDQTTGNNLLVRCYTNSLALADAFEATSIAFPAISTGIYGFSLEDAAIVAARAIVAWHVALRHHTTIEHVYLVAFDPIAADRLNAAVDMLTLS